MTLSGPFPDDVAGLGAVVDRRNDEVESAWVSASRLHDRPPPTTAFTRDGGKGFSPGRGGGPVLIMVSDDFPATAEAVEASVGNGRRTYILAPDGWGEGELPRCLARAEPTSVIVRRLPTLPAAMGLTGSMGCLWMGSNGDKPWRLELGRDQREAARRVFLALFWNEAEDEGWVERGALRWRFCGDDEAPFDVGMPSLEHSPCELRDGPGFAPEGTPDVAYVASGPPPGQVRSRLWIRPSGDDHEALKRLVTQGAQVVWQDLELPTVFTGDHPLLQMVGPGRALGLRPNGKQARDLAAILGMASPQWRFATRNTIASLVEHGRDVQVWLPDDAAPSPIRDEVEVEAGTCDANSLEDLATAKPSFEPPRTLGLQVRYSWRVRIPRVPNDSRLDPLVEQWKETDEEFQRVLDECKNVLSSVSQRLETRDSQTSWIGVEKELDACRTSIEQLGVERPSQLDAAASKALEAAMAALERCQRLKATAEELAQQAEEQKQMDEARADHAGKVAEAQSRVKDLQARIAAKEAEAAQLSREIELLTPSELKEDKRTLKAKQHVLSNTKASIATLETQVESMTRQAEAPFTFEAKPRPFRAARKGFIPEPQVNEFRPLPRELLPSVGELRTSSGRRYLVIDSWDQLESAAPEARRLEATLVAARKAK